MTTQRTVSIPVNPATFNDDVLGKGLFICLLYVHRVPPHIGIVVNGKYHSLTIKGVEPNISAIALLKTIQQRKIDSVFLRVNPHPVFSNDHIDSVFLEILKKYPSIRSHEVTCLSPVKDLFNEFYAVNSAANDMISDFLKRMQENSFILQAYSLNLNLENDILTLPVYTQEELGEKINAIRNDYY